MAALRTDYEALVDELDQAIEMDQVYVCRDLFVHLEPVKTSEDIVAKYYADNEKKIESIKIDIGKCTDLLSKLNDESAWTLANKKSGTTVYFQTPEGSPLILTKTETTFHAKPENLSETFIQLLSFLNETDLQPQWFPDKVLKSSDTVKQITKFSKVVQGKVKLPFPISTIIGPRELIFEGKGYDMSERKAVAITCVPLNEGDKVTDDYTVPGPPANHTRMEMFGAYYFELTDKGIVAKIMQQMDLKSSFVPSAFINWLAKGKAPFDFIKNLKQLLGKFEGSEWEERVKANPTLYGEVKARLDAAGI